MLIKVYINVRIIRSVNDFCNIAKNGLLQISKILRDKLWFRKDAYIKLESYNINQKHDMHIRRCLKSVDIDSSLRKA